MRAKEIGGILLIVGTSVGAGMLALPIANASVGFWPSALLLLLCWMVMTLGAFFLLEVNLYLPPGTNMISMAYETLGKPGILLTWTTYLLLLYALLSAYISGGADMLGALFGYAHLSIASWQAICLFTLLFGAVVYQGIRQVDLLNRLLMFTKLGVYALLLILIAPYIKPAHYTHHSTQGLSSAIMILITSFGYAIIIPSLRVYFNDDINTLKRVVLVGSLIPLFCYLAWNFVIMGAIPATGSEGLVSLMHDPHTTSKLALFLSKAVNSTLISTFFNFFTSICMLTAFLGVSLSLMNFLSDGLKISQKGWSGLGLFLITFLPSTILVIFYPGAYIKALEYAGGLCIVLLLMIPATMSLKGRKHFKSSFVVPMGNISRLALLVTSAALLLLFILD